MRIIPCSISSQEDVNDFKPTPLEDEAAAAVIDRLYELNAQFEKSYSSLGVKAVDQYLQVFMTDY